MLDLLNRPEMSEEEVCTSTGASLENFRRWQRRVLNAQAGLPPLTDDTTDTDDTRTTDTAEV